jgi:hypothetical protein
MRLKLRRGLVALAVLLLAGGCGGQRTVRDNGHRVATAEARRAAMQFGRAVLESPNRASAIRAAQLAGGTPIAEEVHDWYPDLKAQEQLHVVSVSDGCSAASSASLGPPAGNGPCFSLRLLGDVVPDRRPGYRGFGSIGYGTLFVRIASDSSTVYDVTFSGSVIPCRLGHDCDSRERSYRKQPPDF